MKIYTRTGDSGQTSLLGGERVSKHHPRLEAYGTLDELNSWLGETLCRLAAQSNNDNNGWKHSDSITRLQGELILLQNWLFHLGSELATTKTELLPEDFRLSKKHIESLEIWIDQHEKELPKLSQFILPGGHPAACAMHIARTVARRCERSSTALEAPGPIAVQFINRLSDYLFVAARLINQASGLGDVLWQKGKL